MLLLIELCGVTPAPELASMFMLGTGNPLNPTNPMNPNNAITLKERRWHTRIKV